MNPQEKAAVEQYSSEIVDAIVPLRVEELLSHLTNDTKVLHPDSADYLTTTKVFTRDTVHKTINILKVNEKGWFGLTTFLNKHNNAGLVAKLNRMAGKSAEEQTAPVEMKLQDKLKSDPAAASNNRYDNRRKGLAMIINVEDFNDPKRKRNGSRTDYRSSEDLWEEKLGYKLVQMQNPTGQQIKDAMKAFATDPRHKYADSAVVVVMSHGNLEEIEGTDGVGVNIEKFVNGLCKSKLLKGKPKLFLFQACRDEVVQHDGETVAEVEITEATIERSFAWFHNKSDPQSDSIEDTSHADSLLGFATSRGQKAWRKTNGSLYIQEICKVFADDFKTSHAVDMLQTVKENVSRNVIQTPDGPFQQVAHHMDNLSRTFYI